MELLGTLTVRGKSYSRNDVTGFYEKQHELIGDSFYGGRAGSICSFELSRKHGLYLVLDKAGDAINILSVWANGYKEPEVEEPEQFKLPPLEEIATKPLPKLEAPKAPTGKKPPIRRKK